MLPLQINKIKSSELVWLRDHLSSCLCHEKSCYQLCARDTSVKLFWEILSSCVVSQQGLKKNFIFWSTGHNSSELVWLANHLFRYFWNGESCCQLHARDTSVKLFWQMLSSVVVSRQGLKNHIFLSTEHNSLIQALKYSLFKEKNSSTFSWCPDHTFYDISARKSFDFSCTILNWY